ncbi:siphovirus ReqiPepy6 Gp37-like family protein [Metabacillus fastidiosus]|uniref:siphovirus ReqiPepy6 Gp37-like family protein n=1 Tax=Metabacillus fastidiosus TaxID=1458 RepID=UPI003D2C1A19
MLYVCDENFKRLGIIGSFSYLLWRKRYTSHGEAELHVDVSMKNIELLQKGNILFRKDDNEAMYIYYRGFTEDNSGNDQLVIKCFTVVRWFDRRILWEKYNFQDTPDNIIRHMVFFTCLNPTDKRRVIPGLNFPYKPILEEVIQFQISYANLLEQIESLCNTYELGIKSVFDGKNLSFDLYKGTDRTINQSMNPRCILSKNFSNVLSRNYEEADNDFKNTVLVAGAGEDAARKLASIEQGSGLSRRELFVDARDLSATKKVGEEEVPISDEEYTLLLKQRGLEKLLEYEEFISFDCEIDVTKDNTKYGRDFFLGDIITIRDDTLGVIMNSRIVEADEIYRNSVKSLVVKVGKSVPTLPEKVKRMVKS